jgi:dipeptidyl aminopeptidase/acylaminoacyl peptidase
MSTPNVALSFPSYESVIIIKPRVWNRFRFWLITLSAFFLAASTIASFYAYVAWAVGRPAIAPVLSNPLLAAGLPYEDIRFPSADGRSKVDGWYIPGKSSYSVILSHGYGTTREEPWVPMYKLAQELHKSGFNVLMFDYGFVKNRPATGGFHEKEELLGAVHYVRERKASQVYIWGFSMGAGTALQAALIDSKINGMILDSTFILDPDSMYHNLKQHAAFLPKGPSLFMMNVMLPLFNGFNLAQIPYQAVQTAKYKMPLFMIHGEMDDKAPYTQIKHFFSNQKDNALSRMWLLPTGKHELIYRVHAQEYMERSMRFLNECIMTNSDWGKGGSVI